MNPHTPGPWVVVNDDESGKPSSIRALGTHSTAILKFGAFPRPSWADAKANANLIAAAPDLLEALREARSMLVARYGDPSTLPNDNASDRKSLSMFDKIDAAIKKATEE
jgi:hypothetical protein